MRSIVAILLSIFATCATAEEIPAESLRLNQIQVLATHNSYHLRPPEALLRSAIAVQRAAREWDYSREPLDKQLDRGLRSFELDMHLVGDSWHVMHVPVLDPLSTVKTFDEALAVVKAWSDAHPRHLPISFLMELKEEGIVMGRGRGFRAPEAVDLERLDASIRAAFPPERLFTPDELRGKHPTLRAAMESQAWPTLAEVAGKVFFILHETGRNRDLYTAGHESLEGRAMFVESTPGADHCVVIVMNNPTDPKIAELAREGFLVRTRADGQGSWNAERRQKALASGAHLVTTDYPIGEMPADQALTFPEPAPGRGNPVTAPPEWREKPIAEPIPR